MTTVLVTHVLMVDRVWMESALTHVDAHQDIRVIIVKRVGWPLPELNRYIKKKKILSL